MEIIDAMGKVCPIPVIETKKALAGGAAEVLVKVDNRAAVQNLEKMANGLGHSFSFVENSNVDFEVTIGSGGGASGENTSPGIPKTETAVINSAAESVVVIGTKTMGVGSEELGAILIKGFIYALTELPIPPEAVVFYNSGAYLTTEGANTLEDLKKLEAKGTAIMTCGTCVNFFGLAEKLAIGTIVNLYEVSEVMVNAARVINI